MDPLPGAELEVDAEEWRVRKWREGRLLDGGFSQFHAFRLSMAFDVDYRDAIRLLDMTGDEEFVVDQLLD